MASELSQAGQKEPSLLELMAEMQAQFQEQLKRREELESQVSNTVAELRRASNEVDQRSNCVLIEREHVAVAKAELEDKQNEQRRAQADIAAALFAKPARFRFGADELDESENAAGSTAALVTTVRGAPPAALKSFILYHLHLGFNSIFLFFDDPNDPGIEIAKTIESAAAGRVLIYPIDDTIRAEWTTCSLWPELERTVRINNMSRQQLNCELAARKAYTLDIAWIMHIDVDELLDLPVAVGKSSIGGSPVARHFGAVPHEVDYIAYLNHEAVPEKAGEMENYFEEVSLFRCNPHSLPGAFGATGALDMDAVEQESARTDRHRPHLAGIKFWLDKTKEWLGRPTYFQAYSNGKSAARVVPGLRPSGVHRWGEQPGACQFRPRRCTRAPLFELW